jgi:hypothetical protein
MGMSIDKNNYYSSLTTEFTPSCTIKSISSPFINMTLKPAGKLKYNSRNNKCEVIKDGNDD